MRTTKIQFADAGSAATIVKMACERVEGFSDIYKRFERCGQPPAWLNDRRIATSSSASRSNISFFQNRR
ncbi:MAG: hypothetical protein IT223_06300 [Crocinitomicaceae bacterium]|nr:hypothetical protein [Crocinitomicaceae bacterium]